MRRFFAVVLALIMLTGCAREVPPQRETAPEPSGTEVFQEPTVPTAAPTKPPEDADFVRVLSWIPEMEQELKYAGTDNFTGERIYPFWEGYLRYGTVKKLSRANKALAEQGYRIKLWDGYRPVSAQWKLWQACPDPTYVADPERGYSSHSRGNTVDITLVDDDGRELDMPTGFDDFTAKADRDYSDCTDTQRGNAKLLEQTMESCGFTGYYGEWWHFTDTDDYPVEQSFEPPLG